MQEKGWQLIKQDVFKAIKDYEIMIANQHLAKQQS